MKKHYLSFVLLLLYLPNFSLTLSAQNSSTFPELTDFSVSISGAKTIINWTAVSGNKQTYFLLERSGDNKSFSPIFSIEAGPNDKNLQDYEFTDSHPLSGTNFYRLRQLNAKGEMKLNPSIEMTISSSLELDFYISQSDKILELEISNPEKQALKVEILTLNGQVLHQENINPSHSETHMKIGTEHLSTGLYMLRLKSITGKSLSRKFRI
ncbi:MAG: T9SS type A sorting domain-containing protein [Bacteroidota bacterium]